MKLVALFALLGSASAAIAGLFGPEPVTVRLGGAKVGAGQGLRIGDECYVKPGFFSSVGWACSIVDGGVEVNTGLSSAKEAFLSGASERLVPLRALLSALGIKSVWREEQRLLQAVGNIRSLVVSDTAIRFESTLPVEPVITRDEQRGLLVIDIDGALPGSPSDGKVRCEPTSDFSVRITIPTSLLPTELPKEPSTKWEISLSEFGLNLAEPQQVQMPPPALIPESTPKVEVGPPVVVSETAALSTYEFSILGQLASPPTILRVDPSQIQMTFPGATYARTEVQQAMTDIRSIEVSEDEKCLTLNCLLPRPMGALVTATNRKVTLSLYKPEVGDGRIAGKVIVVDPGHGGADTGARSKDGTVNEKDLNLAIAIKVAEKLSKQGATVVMTRKTDVKVPLKERAEIANRNKADFFISIHINSNKLANSRSGSISFYHGGDVISSVLAECLQKHIGSSTGLPSIGVWSDTKIYSSGFAVLRHAKMPAVLLELGFINHMNDLKIMLQPYFRNKVADSVTRGLRMYLGNVEEKEKQR